MKTFLLMLLLFFQAAFAVAGPDTTSASRAQITRIVSAFIQQQTAGLSGKVAHEIEEIDPRIALAPCKTPEAYLPAGSQLLGKSHVGVRCNEGKGWNILVPVQIRITLDLLISSRQLSAGHIVGAGDVDRRTFELSRASGLSDASQVIGKVLRYGIATGQVFRDDMLRAPYSITQGQVVQTILHGRGFSIRNEGVALNNASEGQTVQVRTGSGRVISGIARNGMVELPQ